MKPSRRSFLLLLSLLLTAVTGCHSPSGPRWTRTELYFGLSKPDGTFIPDADWSRFVDEQVVPRFPDGFTVIPAEGRFMQDGQTRAEPTRVVVILHPDSIESDSRIDRLAGEYARRYQQQSVLRADSESRVRFVGR